MGSVTERPPIWLLPRPLGSLPALGSGHPRIALALAVAGLAALAPAFAFLAPATQWGHEAELVALLVFSFYAYVGAAHLRGTASLDAAFVGALLGVVLLGPLAGALIFVAPELTRLAHDRRLTSMLANIASFGWATLAAAGVLEALGYGSPAQLETPGAYLAIAIAGLALLVVNYFYITIVSATIKEGSDLWLTTRREFVPVLPVNVVLLTAAAGTTYLYVEFGLAGLVPLAGIVFIPGLMVPELMRAVPISELTIGEATARYAGGLANVLGLSPRQRRVLRDAATHVGDHAHLTRLEDFDAVMRTVLYSRARWEYEEPGLMSGERIPVESRVLAVARTWAEVTARGTALLEPRAALVHLRARAGEELDPTVVAAAVKIVDDEIIDLGATGVRPAEPAIAA